MGLRDRVVDAIEGEARREQEELEREVQKTRESRKYRKLAKHGEVPVPGRATLDLPSGKVKLRYVESYGRRSAPVTRAACPSGLRRTC